MGTSLLDTQLIDIVALHVCSKLRPCDIQALGQTCTALRRLVDCLPASTWQAVAGQALPTAHPLRSLPGDDIRGCLEQIARAKSLLPEPTLLGIWEGQNDDRSTTSAINHQGTQIMTRKGDALSVYDINHNSSPPSLKLVFTQAPLEPADVENKVTMIWSPNDAFAAIYLMVRDDEDDRSEYNANGWFEVMYCYDAAARALHEVFWVQEYACVAGASLAFSPSGHQLIVPLSDSVDTSGTHLDIYENEGGIFQKAARLRGTRAASYSVAFDPNGQRFAAALRDGAELFDSRTHAVHAYNVQDVAKNGRKVQVAFSPDSTQLGVFLKSSKVESAIHLFDVASGNSRSFAGPPNSRDNYASPNLEGLVISFNSVIAICGSRLFLYSIRPESFGRQLLDLCTSEEGYRCVFAVSSDGGFLAAMRRTKSDGCVKYELLMYQMATGRHLHTFHAPIWLLLLDERGYAGGQMEFNLSWAASALRLLVVCRLSTWAADESYEDAPGDEVEGLLVFDF